MSEQIAYNLLQLRLNNGLSLDEAASLPIIQRFKDSPMIKEILHPMARKDKPKIIMKDDTSVKTTVRIPAAIYSKILRQGMGVATFINQLLFNHFNEEKE